MEENNCTITVQTGKEIIVIEGNTRDTLHSILNNNQISIYSPCGGKGRCGKCRVKVLDGKLAAPSEEEKRHISQEEIDMGIRLACMVKPEGDLKIELFQASGGAKIMTEGADYLVNIKPVVEVTYVETVMGTIHDQRDDKKRLSKAIGKKGLSFSLKTLRKLPEYIRFNNGSLKVIHSGSEVLDIEKTSTDTENYGIAVDIGTTTLVCYLMDNEKGLKMDVISELNLQRSFGSDVISRISYSRENDDGLGIISKSILNQLEKMFLALIKKNGIDLDAVRSVSFAGNTIMLHFLLGLDPYNISVAPFIPVTTGSLSCSLKEMGININNECRAFVLPSVSGYVGADIVAGMLSSGMKKSEEVCLLLDIGTNGEIALGNKEKLVCCSTAAGPAFEGAQIKNGVGGIDGAINTLRLEKGEIIYTTIGDKKPLGICGSGIVDAVALLLDIGIIDETGRFLNDDELTDTSQAFLKRVITDDGIKAFILAYEKETSINGPVVINQKDVREIQLAKASIEAGIKVLLKVRNTGLHEIDIVYLAGGFGSYMDKTNAVKIGLIPKALGDRIKTIGNAAGTGAVMALLSEEARNECEEISEQAEYIELSAVKGFQDELINCMYFE